MNNLSWLLYLAETTLETKVAKRIGAKIEAALDQFIEVE